MVSAQGNNAQHSIAHSVQPEVVILRQESVPPYPSDDSTSHSHGWTTRWFPHFKKHGHAFAHRTLSRRLVKEQDVGNDDGDETEDGDLEQAIDMRKLGLRPKWAAGEP